MTITAPQHRCRQSEDPRHAGYCACGQPMEQGRLRNIEFEREVTRQAARGVLDPDRLIEFSEARAAQPREYGNVQRVKPGRNLLAEMRAELGDCRNYACWWLEENPTDEERVRDVLVALGYVALAFDRLEER